MQDKSKTEDMIGLMRDGYGLPIESFRDHILDVLFRVDHIGGAHAIGKACEAVCIIIKSCAGVSSAIRVISEASGTYGEVSKYKLSELVEVNFKYMESEESGAGFHFSVYQKKTGNEKVDIVINEVLLNMTGSQKAVKI
jgi:hypothetical protein